MGCWVGMHEQWGQDPKLESSRGKNEYADDKQRKVGAEKLIYEVLLRAHST